MRAVVKLPVFYVVIKRYKRANSWFVRENYNEHPMGHDVAGPLPFDLISEAVAERARHWEAISASMTLESLEHLAKRLP